MTGADERNESAKKLENKWDVQLNDTEANPYREDEHAHDWLVKAYKKATSKIDTKDSRTISNRLAEVSKAKESVDEPPKSTSIARSHGNEPSKGAKIDEELQRDDEEYLKRKGKA